jgi:hypothetical protein
LAAATLLADGLAAALGVEGVGPEPLDQGAAHPVGLAVQQQPVSLDPDRPEAVAHPQLVARGAARARLDDQLVQDRVVGPPAGGVGPAEPEGGLGLGARGQVQGGLGGQPDAGRRQPRGRRVGADVLDPDGHGQVAGVAGAAGTPRDHRPVAAQGDRLPDAAVGQVEAGRAREHLVGPALLAVGQAQVLGRPGRRVGDPDRQLVDPSGQGGRGIDLEGGERQVVGADQAAVEVDLGQVHDRPEAKGPVPGRVVEREPPPVPGHAVQVEQALGLPEPGDLHRHRVEVAEGVERVVAREQLPGAVERPASAHRHPLRPLLDTPSITNRWAMTYMISTGTLAMTPPTT